ncbi:MAG TPA: TetR/AcrR family transcriptional regulator [Actinoplanes sp.]|nr:TetR/AcrR family transcriptional regulator [Actinoplanes sp.]
MPRVSEDHLTARREQILVAARACFLRHGIHSTSMQDLIREAGLSVGAVYRYFKSKNDIINAVAESVVGGILVALRDVLAKDLPLIDTMSEVLDVIDTQLGPDGAFPLAVQIWAESTLDPAIGAIVRDRYQGLREVFQQVARDAVRRGEVPPDADIDAVASALFAMIPGYALQRMILGFPDKETYLTGIRTLLSSR